MDHYFQPEHLFAQADDPGDYDNSGWVCLVDKDNDRAAIESFSHCSCYGTWDSLDLNDPVWDGTISELVVLAIKNCDPHLPIRERQPGDHRDSLLDELYAEIVSRVGELSGYKKKKKGKDMKLSAELTHHEIVNAIKEQVKVPEGYKVNDVEIEVEPGDNKGQVFSLTARVELVEDKEQKA